MLLPVPAPLLSPEIADLRRDITRGYVTEILESQDEILRNQGGYGAHALTIYEALKTDDQVQACMGQLIDGANKLEYEVVLGERKGRSPMRIDTKATEFIQEIIDNLDFKNIIAEILWTKFYGYGVAELLPTRDGANTILDFSKGGIKVRNRRRFRFDFDLNVRLLTLDNSYPGELMHSSRVWTAKYGADNSDEPYGLGDASGCYWWVIFKKGGVRSWLRFLREFAQPTTIVRHPPHLTDDGQTEINNFIADIENGRSTAISNNVEISYLEASRNGTSDYGSLVDVCNRSIARMILGATETTESSKSSGYAQAKVHEDVLDSTITAIDRIVFSSFNRQAIAKLCYWNYPEAIPPVLRRKRAEEDANVRADRDAKLFDLGIRLNPKAIPKIYGEDYLVVEGENTTVLLNGAQIASITQLTKDAAAGAIPIESARQLMIATLSIPEAIADKIVQPLLDKEKEVEALESAQAKEEEDLFSDTNNQAEQQTAEVPAEFAEFYNLEAIEFAAKSAAAPKKKNCTKGVYCVGKTGKGSCVKAGSKCRAKADQGSQDYASAIGPEVAVKAKDDISDPDTKAFDLDSISLRKEFKPKDIEISGETDFGDFVRTSISAPERGYLGKGVYARFVSFTVNGEYDAQELEGGERAQLRAALLARRQLIQEFKKMPDGTIVANTPWDFDGKGKERANIYEKAGFSKNDPDRKIGQLGIIYKGKVYPITHDQLEAKFDSIKKKGKKDGSKYLFAKIPKYDRSAGGDDIDIDALFDDL